MRTNQSSDHKLFGQSEGVLFVRGVSEAMSFDEKTKFRSPGGTWKIGYLSGIPVGMLDRHRVLIGGLHARLAWIQEGHRNSLYRH